MNRLIKSTKVAEGTVGAIQLCDNCKQMIIINVKSTAIFASLLRWKSHDIISSSQHHKRLELQHSSNLCLSSVFIQAMIQMLPPFKEHSLAYQFEPWREFEAVVLEHGLKFRLRNVSSIFHFIRICCVVNIGFDEQDVVN